jgi:hypothetical protein
MKTVKEIDMFDCVKSNSMETFDTPSRSSRHYLEAFRQFQEKKSIFKIIKFNWAAFIFGPFSFYNYDLQSEELNPIGIFTNLFIMVVLGFIGTPLYISVCKKRIEEFSTKSGTTLIVPLIICIILLLVYVALNIFGIMQYLQFPIL